jgi:predicted short-subunit dehydrogenase-like oxidoreductase (DUF2520 family)
VDASRAWPADAAQPPDAATSSRPGRFTVGVIGAGRVGPVLAAALARAGHSVVAASGVSERSRRRAEEMLPGVPLLPSQEVAVQAELLLITVPDDALEQLAAGLVSTGGIRQGKVVVHTSGRYGIGVLEPVLKAGALPLALHPVMTFTGTDVDLPRLSGCSFGVTAPEQFRPMAETLVVEMGGEPEWIAEERRPLYHAALASGSNHLVTLVAQAADLLRASGVAQPNHMLAPLLSAALDNALRSGDAALTGPVARGDAGTVAAHLAELDRVAPDGPVRAAYLAMARLTADRALAAGLLTAEQAAPLLGVLSVNRVEDQ